MRICSRNCSGKMPEIEEELIIFLVSVVTGIMLRLIYQSISCFRQLIDHSRLAMGVEDMIFWLGAALYVFVQIYYTSDGSIRWYFILGLVSGAAFCTMIFIKIKKVNEKNLH